MNLSDSHGLLPHPHRITLRSTEIAPPHHTLRAGNMSQQSRISAFFAPSPTTAAYEAQLQRDRNEHSIAAQESAIQRTEQQARKRIREQSNTQEAVYFT